MLNRTLTLIAGFFFYVASLLCFVQVPPEISKPALTGGFAAIGLVCAGIVLVRRRFTGWRKTLAGILIGGSLMSLAAVAAITLLRTSDSIRQRIPTKQFDGFNDYRTGIAAASILLAAGGVLVLAQRTTKPRA